MTARQWRRNSVAKATHLLKKNMRKLSLKPRLHYREKVVEIYRKKILSSLPVYTANTLRRVLVEKFLVDREQTLCTVYSFFLE